MRILYKEVPLIHLLPDFWHEKVAPQSFNLALVEELKKNFHSETSAKEHFCFLFSECRGAAEAAGRWWLTEDSGCEREVLLRPACLFRAVCYCRCYSLIPFSYCMWLSLMHKMMNQGLMSPGLMPHFESFQWKRLSLLVSYNDALQWVLFFSPKEEGGLSFPCTFADSVAQKNLPPLVFTSAFLVLRNTFWCVLWK